MNRREVFDKVKEHLLSQGVVSRTADSMDGIETCRYRGPWGRQCAVGCLIDDDHYYEGLEGYAVTEAGVIEVLRKSGVPADSDTIDMLYELQSVHDDMLPSHWEEALEEIEAQWFGGEV